MIHYAARLEDLKVLPGNRLESLSGDLKEFHSIRINERWRIVFRWTDAGPCDVKVINRIVNNRTWSKVSGITPTDCEPNACIAYMPGIRAHRQACGYGCVICGYAIDQFE